MADTAKLQIEKIINEILGTIDREREREIVARRFGLFDRRETLEQIGELLGITRERVRQLEKAVVARLKAHADGGQLPHIGMVQDAMIEALGNMGKVSRVSDLTPVFSKENSRINQARISFLARYTPLSLRKNRFNRSAVSSETTLPEYTPARAKLIASLSTSVAKICTRKRFLSLLMHSSSRIASE